MNKLMKKNLLMNVWMMLALFMCMGIFSCSDNSEDGVKEPPVLRLVDKNGNSVGGISGGDYNLTGNVENLTLRVMSNLDWKITIPEGLKLISQKESVSKKFHLQQPRMKGWKKEKLKLYYLLLKIHLFRTSY